MADIRGTITVQEAARRLGRSIEQVRRYLREGKLRGERIGGQWFIDEASLAGVGIRYVPTPPVERVIREAAAVLEAPPMKEATGMKRNEIDALINEIRKNREAIRTRLGGDIGAGVVEMIREDRESH